jgi:hypothetical protein
MNYYIIIWGIVLILLIIYTYLYKPSTHENYENVKSDIGNVLSSYYYNLVLSIFKKEDFNYSNDSPFIKEFPKFIKWNEEMYNELIKNNISLNDIINIEPVAFWNIHNSKLEKIHTIMKPTIHTIFDNTFKKLNLKKEIKNPIIHFRCADTPFIKHERYYFQKYSYFNNSLKELQDKIGKFTDVTILACFTHVSSDEDKQSCNIYVNKLKEHLNKYNIHIDCNSNVDDFVSMFYAPAVISTISSFSFMSGYFGNGIYIQPNAMLSDKEVCLDCDNQYKGYNIPHNKVNDYHNVDEVYKLLID